MAFKEQSHPDLNQNNAVLSQEVFHQVKSICVELLKLTLSQNNILDSKKNYPWWADKSGEKILQENNL